MTHEQLSEDDITERMLDVVRATEPRPESIDDGLAHVRDRQAVHDVLVAYCFFQDEKRYDESVLLFTPDCRRQMAGSVSELLIGRDALRDASGAAIDRSDPAGSVAATRDEMSHVRFRHLLCTEMIKLGPDGRHARLVAHCQVAATVGQGTSFRHGAHEATYYIEFVRESAQPDNWLIDLLVIRTDHATNPLFQHRDDSTT